MIFKNTIYNLSVALSIIACFSPEKRGIGGRVVCVLGCRARGHGFKSRQRLSVKTSVLLALSLSKAAGYRAEHLSSVPDYRQSKDLVSMLRSGANSAACACALNTPCNALWEVASKS